MKGRLTSKQGGLSNIWILNYDQMVFVCVCVRMCVCVCMHICVSVYVCRSVLLNIWMWNAACLSGYFCRTATKLNKLMTRITTCSFKRNYFGWWKEKRAHSAAESAAVSCCASEMQSGLQCVTRTAVGRRSQLPVKIRARTLNVNV